MLLPVFPSWQLIEADPRLGATAAGLLVTAAVAYFIHQIGWRRRG